MSEPDVLERRTVAPPPDALKELCREAAERVSRALAAWPAEWKAHADEAERAAVRLRDGLILRLREPQPAATGRRLRDCLERVNTTITLLHSQVYPAGSGAQRQPLEDAGKLLRGLTRRKFD